MIIRPNLVRLLYHVFNSFCKTYYLTDYSRSGLLDSIYQIVVQWTHYLNIYNIKSKLFRYLDSIKNQQLSTQRIQWQGRRHTASTTIKYSLSVFLFKKTWHTCHLTSLANLKKLICTISLLISFTSSFFFWFIFSKFYGQMTHQSIFILFYRARILPSIFHFLCAPFVFFLCVAFPTRKVQK